MKMAKVTDMTGMQDMTEAGDLEVQKFPEVIQVQEVPEEDTR
jgi:hypothetical protein